MENDSDDGHMEMSVEEQAYLGTADDRLVVRHPSPRTSDHAHTEQQRTSPPMDAFALNANGEIAATPAPAPRYSEGFRYKKFFDYMPKPPPRKMQTMYNNQPIDPEALEYISKVDTNLICLICRCPFTDPLQLDCDHTFCKMCICQTFSAQPQLDKTCPTCRKFVSYDYIPHGPPLIVRSMLDELIVKCIWNRPPDKHCTWVGKRGEVQDHVDLYCEETMVKCPTDACVLPIWRRSAERWPGRCGHKNRTCDYCGHVCWIAKMFDHHEKECPNIVTNCEDCEAVVKAHRMILHVKDDCPNTTITCPGEAFGCTYSDKRPIVEDHAKTCPIAIMTPALAAQAKLVDQHAKSSEFLERKVAMLEGSLQAIQSMLSSPLDAPPSDAPLSTTQISNSNIPSATPSDPTIALTPPEAPYESSTHHLLSLHESLREEVTRISTSLADLDGRHTMMIINEGLRAKEDMSHANAAINSMRMQLHWLTSARLQQNARAGAQASASGTNNFGSGFRGGTGGGNGGGGAAAGSSGSAGAGLAPVRRLSDEGRTKL